MMPAGKRTVVARIEAVSVEHGLWCDRCLLPSAARIHLAVTTGARMRLAEKQGCLDCGSPCGSQP